MLMLPLRLVPGQDLRSSLELAVSSHGCTAAFAISGIGSLSDAHLRFADASTFETFPGPTEILSLSGTVAANGSHLHMSLATASGEVFGGHVMPGCIVRTTAEVLLGLLSDWEFSRERDALTGFAELAISPKGQ
jgi:predicted DNA-binding protein with PD1-like motif